MGSVDSLRNLPATALYGGQLIFFVLLGALFFLIPTALVSAELASGWPKQGGVYIWIKEAFGKKVGFLAIWLQWIENVIWYPIMLSFVAGSIGYVISPTLADNPFFIWCMVLVIFWAITFLNFTGMSFSAMFSNVCAILGLLIPTALIVGWGIFWLLSGNTSQISLTSSSIMPNLYDKQVWLSLTAIIMSFCGVEIATVHANDVENPQYAFPKALLYSVVIILATLILGALTIAIAVPKTQIDLLTGLVQAFDKFFRLYHISYLVPIVAVMLAIGGLGSVNNWIIAPTKGLLVAAEDGNIPAIFQKVNKAQAPTTMLLWQGGLVTVLATLFLWMPTVGGTFWTLTVLTTQTYMMMYFLMFLAVIKLRISKPKQYRAFRLPGGVIGLIIIAGMGLIGTLATFIISFFPPEAINVGNVKNYEATVITGLILLLSPVLLSLLWQKFKS